MSADRRVIQDSSDSDADSDIVASTPPFSAARPGAAQLRRAARAKGEAAPAAPAPSPLVSGAYRERVDVVSSSESDGGGDEDHAEDSPLVSVRKRPGLARRALVSSEDEDESDEVRSTSGTPVESTGLIGDDDDEDGSDEDPPGDAETSDEDVEAEQSSDEAEETAAVDESEPSVVEVSSDDDEVVGSASGGAVEQDGGNDEEEELILSPEQVQDLQADLAKNRRALDSNLKMLVRKDRLPDGGAKLERHVEGLLQKQDAISQKLEKAKLRRSDGSDSNASSSAPGSSASSANASPADDGLAQKLKALVAKRATLRQQCSLIRPTQLPDGGATLRREIADLDFQIMKLENSQRGDFVPLGGKAPDAKKNAWIKDTDSLHNSEWQKFRQAIGNGPSSSAWEPEMDHKNLYGGRMNVQRRQEAVQVTMAALKDLHSSLETMPAECDQEEQPRALRHNVSLMPHQRQALAWLLWREEQKPSGGILADDMGLGKTLTMISLILKHKEISGVDPEEKENQSAWFSKHKGLTARSSGTLVICPASLIQQWEGEVKKRISSGNMSVLVYHGANRGRPAKALARYDLVITTYGTVMTEVKPHLAKEEGKKLEDMRPADEHHHQNDKTAQLAAVAWERIILDEAHSIRNPRSQTARAVTLLQARRRWAVTGTPIQNRELDMFSLLRFLRCHPFDEYRVWKLWVDNKTSQGQTRMNTLVQSLLLRRTKTTKSAETGSEIVKLPPKEIKEHRISLSSDEKEVYDEVFSFSQQAMMTYMRKHQDKEDDKAYMAHMESGGRASEYAFKPTESNRLRGGMAEEASGDQYRPKLGPTGKDVKAHHLLVLLLRLRQICCHPGLIKSMIDTEARAAAGAIEDKELGADGVDDDLVSQLADMSLTNGGASAKDEEVKSCLNLDNPVFKERRQSSKISKVVEELTRIHKRYEETGVMEKAVVVSQWTSMLEIIKCHVERVGLRCTEINGKVPVKLRGEVVTAFNRKGSAPHVMLLSLAAGGVGLNLVGANHLFLLDMHWNPQLEQQACDRIYRVGQTREVTIHRFLCEDTVETRIQDLQKKKLDLAEGVLTGAKRTGANKLTMDDLKMLFNVK